MSDKAIHINYEEYTQHFPYIDDDAIYVPSESVTRSDLMPAYKVLITKELFVEAYNKWIEGKEPVSKTFIEGVKPEDDYFTILNWYRNLYYKEGNNTEQGIMANTINELFKDLQAQKAENKFIDSCI